MIDVERLKNDRDYWDECDPTGGEATHYDANDGDPDCPWMRLSAEHDWEAWSGDRSHWLADVSGDDYAAAYIPRPARKQWSGPEDGLPPVGLECESALAGGCYRAGRITYKSDQIIVWIDKLSCHEYATRPTDRVFRPRKSEKERVVEAAMKIGGLRARDGAKEVYAALYDAGFLKMPEGNQ